MVDGPQLETVVTPRKPGEQPGPVEPGVIPAGGTYQLETVVVPRKPKHLEFIQQTIDRMESNSILLKGWTIILTATLLGLFSDDATSRHIFTLCLPIIGFWVLDGIFQSQQRQFRALHDRVRNKRERDIDFSMDLTEEKNDPKNGLVASMFFSNLGLFYAPVVIIVLVTAGLLSI